MRHRYYGSYYYVVFYISVYGVGEVGDAYTILVFPILVGQMTFVRFNP